MANSHDQVAHNWAHQAGRKTRGHSMFYEGETIYSYGYHFPLARFFTAPNGEQVILLNNSSRSISTSKHKSIVRRSIGYDDPRVIAITDEGELISRPSAHNAERTIRNIREQNLESAKKWTRAHKWKSVHAIDMECNVATINRLIALFQLDMPAEIMPSDIAADIAADIEREKQARIEQDKREREAIRDWLSGEKDTVPRTRQVYVRVKNGEVQTSWGIKVPLRRALAIYRLANHCAKCSHEYTPCKPQTIGSWRIDRISSDGTIRAGCHIIPLNIQKLGANLAGLEP